MIAIESKRESAGLTSKVKKSTERVKMIVVTIMGENIKRDFITLIPFGPPTERTIGISKSK